MRMSVLKEISCKGFIPSLSVQILPRRAPHASSRNCKPSRCASLIPFFPRKLYNSFRSSKLYLLPQFGELMYHTLFYIHRKKALSPKLCKGTTTGLIPAAPRHRNSNSFPVSYSGTFCSLSLVNSFENCFLREVLCASKYQTEHLWLPFLELRSSH